MLPSLADFIKGPAYASGVWLGLSDPSVCQHARPGLKIMTHAIWFNSSFKEIASFKIGLDAAIIALAQAWGLLGILYLFIKNKSPHLIIFNTN